MMTDHEPVTPEELLAHADGRLPESRRSAVEAHLAAHPEAAAEVEHWRRQNDALHALFDGVAEEPVPARLSPHRIARARAAGRRRFAFAAMAASALFAVGIGVGWLGSSALTERPSAGETLAVAALSAHAVFAAEGRHAVEVAASEEQHLTTWLSNRVGEPLIAPDLSAYGYALVGGRLLPFDDTRAAQLMYEDASGGRVTMYITQGGSMPPEVAFAAAGPLNSYYWTSDAINCAMVGELDREDLRDVATSAWRQLVAAI